jgi:hypothetical protein
MSDLSDDALIFGLAYLHGPSRSLSFGGLGAGMIITERAENALRDLLVAGYAEKNLVRLETDPNRRHYIGTEKAPHLGQIAQERGLSLFDPRHKWPTFVSVAPQKDRPHE